MRDRIRRLRRRVPVPPARIAVLAALYAVMLVGALAVAFGATAFVYHRVGLYAAAVVGGTVAFALSYVGVRAIDVVTGERNG